MAALPPEIEALAQEGEQRHGRSMILIFCAGPIGEDVRLLRIPWEEIMDEMGRESDIVDIIEAAWETLHARWRFVGAIDSRTAQVVMSVPTFGCFGLQKAVEVQGEPTILVRMVVDEDPPPEDPPNPDDPAIDPEDPDARRLILVFTGGAIGQNLRTARYTWHDDYASAHHIRDLIQQVTAAWTQINAQWWFVAAIDSSTANVVASVSTLGWLAVQRIRAYDCLPMPDDCADPEDPISSFG